MNELNFPSDFLWGVATASYQVEGGYDEGGRSPSIWDTFSEISGNVLNGDTGRISVDQYHRFNEDVAIMKKIGIQAYRFSIAWTRIISNGVGDVNMQGVAYYKNLIVALKKAGIKPVATLYHWDLPQCLEDRGGWR